MSELDHMITAVNEFGWRGQGKPGQGEVVDLAALYAAAGGYG
jgi:hypothetical protein